MVQGLNSNGNALSAVVPQTPLDGKSVYDFNRARLGNVLGSPLTKDDALKRAPCINCFSLRVAMEMHLSRLELKTYSVYGVGEMKMPVLEVFLNRAEKTMANSSSPQKSAHLALLLKEVYTKKNEDWIKVSGTNKATSALLVRFSALKNKIEVREKEVNTRITAKLASYTSFKSLGDSFKDSDFLRFINPCCMRHVGTHELNNLSIPFLLEQSTEDLSFFVQRAAKTIQDTGGSKKALILTSLLVRLYCESTDYHEGEKAGNKKAVAFNSLLEGVLDDLIKNTEAAAAASTGQQPGPPPGPTGLQQQPQQPQQPPPPPQQQPPPPPPPGDFPDLPQGPLLLCLNKSSRSSGSSGPSRPSGPNRQSREGRPNRPSRQPGPNRSDESGGPDGSDGLDGLDGLDGPGGPSGPSRLAGSDESGGLGGPNRPSRLAGLAGQGGLNMPTNPAQKPESPEPPRSKEAFRASLNVLLLKQLPRNFDSDA